MPDEATPRHCPILSHATVLASTFASLKAGESPQIVVKKCLREECQLWSEKYGDCKLAIMPVLRDAQKSPQ